MFMRSFGGPSCLYDDCWVSVFLISIVVCLFFFSKQKTAYEMRISDWSSDVCSSDLMHTPGHTPACSTYVVGDAAFVGDTLFMPDYGTARCDFPGGDARQLYRSIRKILALPPATRLFLCHDYKAPGRDHMANQGCRPLCVNSEGLGPAAHAHTRTAKIKIRIDADGQTRSLSQLFRQSKRTIRFSFRFEIHRDAD